MLQYLRWLPMRWGVLMTTTVASLAWLIDPDDTRIQAALTRSCDLCGAKKHQWCRNTINPNQPLPGRLVHHGRLIDRTREPKGDE
ncbi:hypothetical protein MTY414_59770 [Mycolicibacterium mageritense]|nr:hypothetical protein MTY414_59770 [Mycolicibacterium mageritense]